MKIHANATRAAVSARSSGNAPGRVLKTANLKDDDVLYGETHLFVGPNFLVSVRHGDTAGYAVVRERCEDTANMLAKGPGFAVYANDHRGHGRTAIPEGQAPKDVKDLGAGVKFRILLISSGNRFLI